MPPAYSLKVKVINGSSTSSSYTVITSNKSLYYSVFEPNKITFSDNSTVITPNANYKVGVILYKQNSTDTKTLRITPNIAYNILQANNTQELIVICVPDTYNEMCDLFTI